MLKTLVIATIVLSSTALFTSAAQARGRRCCCAAAPAVAAPAAATAAAPTSGTRSFSYEPGSESVPQTRNFYLRSGAPNPYRDAGAKVRGE